MRLLPLLRVLPLPLAVMRGIGPAGRREAARAQAGGRALLAGRHMPLVVVDRVGENRGGEGEDDSETKRVHASQPPQPQRDDQRRAWELLRREERRRQQLRHSLTQPRAVGAVPGGGGVVEDVEGAVEAGRGGRRREGVAEGAAQLRLLRAHVAPHIADRRARVDVEETEEASHHEHVGQRPLAEKGEPVVAVAARGRPQRQVEEELQQQQLEVRPDEGEDH
mmetsp:Transcript_41915/g.132329  ORF Transcript_41915/g.132329 Transcript_41915/m.132329 type:complete len:222 (-) Transcript_41915:561-1226(-)